jgi:hypothetical protein
MFEKSEALDYALNGLVSSILEDSANDGLKCRSNHLGCCVIRSLAINIQASMPISCPRHARASLPKIFLRMVVQRAGDCALPDNVKFVGRSKTGMTSYHGCHKFRTRQHRAPFEVLYHRGSRDACCSRRGESGLQRRRQFGGKPSEQPRRTVTCW